MNTIIKNINLIDGKGELYEDYSIAFNSSGIIDIDKKITEKGYEKIIDGRGRYCLPGLIDLHVHLNLDGNPDMIKQITDDNEGMAALRSLKNGLTQLKNGVTTVRNCGSKYNVDITLRDAIAEGVWTGPNIVACGEPIVMTGGHCHYFSHEIDGPYEARKAARSQFKKGADFIKVMATSGGNTKNSVPGATQLSEEEITNICVEALNIDNHVAAHAQGNEGIINSINAGVKTIEHGVELDEEALNLMLKNNVYLIATLAAPHNVIKNSEEGQIPEHVIRSNKLAQIPHKESFMAAIKAGVKIGVGTDAGTPFNFHGDYVTELEIMNELGMDEMAVINSATSVGAEVLGRQKEIGTLERNKRADIILVNENPLNDIGNLRKIDKVFSNGIEIL